MDSKEMFEQLEIVIVIMSIMSLAAFVYFAYRECRTKEYPLHFALVDNIILFVLLWMYACILIIPAWIYYTNPALTALLKEVLLYCAALLVVVIPASLELLRNRTMRLKAVLPPFAVILTATVLGLWFCPALRYIFNGALALYLIMIVLFVAETIRANKRVSRVGLMMSVTGILLIVVTHQINRWSDFHFTMMLDLALCMMLIIGFFLHYCEMYSVNLLTKIKSVERNREKLSHADRRIAQLAFEDQATGISNTNRLEKDMDELGEQWDRMKEESVYFAMINLRKYANLTSWMGYNQKKAIMREVAQAISAICENGDRLYRFQSNRFVLRHTGTDNSCERQGERIRTLLRSERFQSLHFEPYIGFTRRSSHNRSMDRLIQELETASASAYESNGLSACYSEAMYLKTREQNELEEDLLRASEDQEWELAYQPKICMKSERIVGAEALMRWRRKGKDVSPEQFIPLAEKLGLIGELGQYAIERSFSFMALLGRNCPSAFMLSINLSPYQLMEPDFAYSVIREAGRHGIQPRRILFEITESALMKNFGQAEEAIRQLRERGFSFSLDDFGVGYSSIQYFSRLPLNEVKFDKTFTESLIHDGKNRIILGSFIEMARKLGVRIVIEGVETQEHWKIAKEMQPDYYQGYFYSKPVTSIELMRMLKGEA